MNIYYLIPNSITNPYATRIITLIMNSIARVITGFNIVRPIKLIVVSKDEKTRKARKTDLIGQSSCGSRKGLRR